MPGQGTSEKIWGLEVRVSLFKRQHFHEDEGAGEGKGTRRRREKGTLFDSKEA